jgi:long-chain acyl-CoA synthetase
LHLPNTPHFVIGFFAVLMAGACVVNFSPLAARESLDISSSMRISRS